MGLLLIIHEQLTHYIYLFTNFLSFISVVCLHLSIFHLALKIPLMFAFSLNRGCPSGLLMRQLEGVWLYVSQETVSFRSFLLTSYRELIPSSRRMFMIFQELKIQLTSSPPTGRQVQNVLQNNSASGFRSFRLVKRKMRRQSNDYNLLIYDYHQLVVLF